MKNDIDMEKTPPASDKAALRRTLIARRDRIGEADQLERSASMCERLSAHLAEKLSGSGSETDRRPPSVALYAAMGSEPTLDRFVLEAARRGWNCFFPVMVKEAPTPQGSPRIRMRFVQLTTESYRRRDLPFLAQPAKSVAEDELAGLGLRTAQAEDFDAVVVPLVGFDEKNNRLGYGGGNYDRFLAETRPESVVVGFAFAEQRWCGLPVEAHDIPLPDIIVG